MRVDARVEELHHELPRVPHPLGVGLHLHLRLDPPGARRHEDARALDLDDTHPAGVDRREVARVAHRGRVDALGPARVEDRRALRDTDGRPSISTSTSRLGASSGHGLAHAAPPSKTPAARSPTARRWPPSGRARRSRRPASLGRPRRSGRARPVGEPIGRARDEPMERLFLPDRAHPAWHALPAALVAEEPSDPEAQVHEIRALVEDHDHARAERVAALPRVLERELRRRACPARRSRPPRRRAARP